MNDNKHHRIEVPFSGFSATVHDHEIDGSLKDILRVGNTEEIDQDLYNQAHNDIDWRNVSALYAKAYVETIAGFFECTKGLTFVEVVSPKHGYNDINDRIFASLPESDVRAMHEAADPAVLAAEAKDAFTPREGYAPHYSADVESWGDVSQWDHNQLNILFRACMRTEGYDPERLESDIACDFRDTLSIDNFIYDSAGSECQKAFDRADDMHMEWKQRRDAGLVN